MAVEDIDHGYSVIIDQLSKLHGRVKVGLFADSGDEDGTSLAEIAGYNEYGTAHIPPRPFVRQTVDKKSFDWGSAAAKLEDRVAKGMSTHQALEILGNKAEGDMKEEVTKGNFRPNAPSTIRQKGSAQPLIDTGRMRNSIKHKVEE